MLLFLLPFAQGCRTDADQRQLVVGRLRLGLSMEQPLLNTLQLESHR